MTLWESFREPLHDAIARVFGEDVEYTPPGGAPMTVNGEWHEDAVASEVGGEVPVSDQQHSIDLRLNALPGEPEPGAQIVSTSPAHAGTWTVVDVQLNGDGKATLRLHKVS